MSAQPGASEKQGAPANKEGEEGLKNGTITVAVSGNPNSGKSTLINAIAGTRLHVGNWPGVTVERREAEFECGGRRIKLVDLPGTYSLSPYTQEETLAREYLIHEKPDVIIDVVDATNLERNLYLTIQLMELEIPMVMALNIYDEAESKGFAINTEMMEEMLGIKVIPTVATKKKGLDALLESVFDVLGEQNKKPKQLSYGAEIDSAASKIGSHIERAHPSIAGKYPQRWLALKVMEGDERVLAELGLRQSDLPSPEEIGHLRKAHDSDMESIMADARYAQAAGLTREVLQKPEFTKLEWTEKIDRVLLNRFLGIPIFLATMWFMFKLTFDLSKPFMDWIDGVTAGPGKRLAESVLTFLHAPEWTISLFSEGIIAGVGFVLTFVPVIFGMMFFITFLEGSGYMARAAFIMDRAMHAMGLHGRSFIPMLLGFGCNVPAIYATRTLENPRDKALTALLIPLMSCGARLPVYVLFAGAFFGNNAGTAIWSIYVLGIGLAICMGVLFKKTLFRGETPPFIMELPPYRMPTMASLSIHTWEKGKHFLTKAGTYIFAVSILVWFLLNLPWGVENKKDSYLGKAGQSVAAVFQPTGFGNWESTSSLITGIIAKEIVIGTMGEIYVGKEEEKKETATFYEDLAGVGMSFVKAIKESASNVFSTLGISSLSTEEETDKLAMRSAIQKTFTPLSAYAFMAFVLLYMPCVVVLIAMRHEFMTWKWVGIAFVYQMALAWTVAFVIYQGGRLLGLD